MEVRSASPSGSPSSSIPPPSPPMVPFETAASSSGTIGSAAVPSRTPGPRAAVLHQGSEGSGPRLSRDRPIHQHALPADLLGQIDALARERDMSRAEFIRAAAAQAQG